MNKRNVLAFCALLAIGYLMYIQSPGSRSVSGRSAAVPLQKVATLEERGHAQIIARQLHDQRESTFTWKGIPTRFHQLPEDKQKLISREYYQLYPEECPLRFIQTIKGPFRSAKFTPHGNLFLAGRNAVHILQWKHHAFRKIQSVKDVCPGKFAVSATGNWFVVGLQYALRVYAKGADQQFALQQEIPIDAHPLSQGTLAVGDTPENDKMIAFIYRNPNHLELLDLFSQNPGASFHRIQQIRIERSEMENQILFDATGTRFAYPSGVENLKVWGRNNVGTFHLIQTLHSPFKDNLYPKNVAFSPDNSLVVLGVCNHIVIWKEESAESFTLMQHMAYPRTRGVSNHGIRRIVFKPDDSNCFVSADSEGVKIWYRDQNSHAFRQAYMIPARARNVSLSADGKIAIVLEDNSVQIWSFPCLMHMHAHLVQRLNPEAIHPEIVVPASHALYRLKAIAHEKRAIRANRALTKDKKESQLELLRKEEQKLKELCAQQAASSALQEKK